MTKKDNAIRDKVLRGLDLSYHKLLKAKKKNNQDVVVSDNGNVKILSAKDLL
jgi:hypothetical protein